MTDAPEVHYYYPVQGGGQFQQPYYYYANAPAGAVQPPYPHGYAAYPGAGYPAYPAMAQPAVQHNAPFFNFSSDRFVKGLLIGAVVTYVVTNESVQRNAIKGAVKVWTMLQGGVEELKERFHDAEAEIRAAEQSE